jgi:hypothetical protein
MEYTIYKILAKEGTTLFLFGYMRARHFPRQSSPHGPGMGKRAQKPSVAHGRNT